MDEVLFCSYCDFQCSSYHLLLRHVQIHENLPDFLVYCSDCGKSFPKWSSLRRHLQRTHKNISITFHDSTNPLSSTSDNQCCFDDSEAYSSFYSESTQAADEQAFDSDHSAVACCVKQSEQFNSALFLLKLSSSLNLTHVGVDSICESTHIFCRVYIK